MSKRNRTRVLAAAAAIAVPAASPAQEHGAAGFPVPESIRAEHAEIHGALERATRAPGRVGEAARALAAVLHPHFVREEQIALPPLALLRPLAEGRFEPSMRAVLPMTDSLRAELPQMLREHVRIGAAARRLEQVAREEGNAEVELLAQKLQLHARSEEEVLYPAAVLVGDLVRARG
jgi:hypothetical protein